MTRALLLALLIACVAADAAGAALRLEPVPGPAGPGQPFRSPAGAGPIFVASPPGDTHRLLVGTRDGLIYLIRDGELRPTPYADLRALTTTDGQNGLMSFAFDADWAANGRMYVMYSDTNVSGPLGEAAKFRDVKVDVLGRSADDPDRADPAARANVITIPNISQGACTIENAHHGGQVHVGEDGHLWISVGDGGDGCGAHFAAGQLTTLRGKILRIAPSAAGGYTVPPDNPLVGQGGGVKPEIWANGLRNPWRFAFDRVRDEVVIGDVGNTAFEEVDVAPATLRPGVPPPFFGWGCFEHDVAVFTPCNQAQPQVPARLAFAHAPEGGCVSLTGGVVVDDPSLGAEYQGRYLYGYFCAPSRGTDGGHSRLLSVDLAAATPAPRSEGLFVTAPGAGAGVGLVSFGEDGCGHPHAMNLFTGWLFRIEGETPGPCGQHRPPETTITAAPEGRVAEVDALVTFSSTVRGSTFRCAVDGAPASPCASPVTFAGLGEGDHTLEVAARDEAGNVDPTPARATWRTDALPPETRIVAAPPAVDASGEAVVEFAVEDGEPRCSVDGAPAAPCASPLRFSGLAVGAHSVVVDAVDATGRTDPTPAVARWEVVPVRAADPLSLAPVRVVGARRLRASRAGRVSFALGGFPVATRVTTRVRRAGGPAGTARPVTGRPGRSVRVTIVLSRATRALVRRRGRVTLSVTVRLAAPGAGARELVVPLVVLRPRAQPIKRT